MALCWHCNGKVRFLADGWFCTECGKHGAPDLIADDWEHGREINAPYMEKKNAD
jgi:hypothetical protein